MDIFLHKNQTCITSHLQDCFFKKRSHLNICIYNSIPQHIYFLCLTVNKTKVGMEWQVTQETNLCLTPGVHFSIFGPFLLKIQFMFLRILYWFFFQNKFFIMHYLSCRYNLIILLKPMFHVHCMYVHFDHCYTTSRICIRIG